MKKSSFLSEHILIFFIPILFTLHNLEEYLFYTKPIIPSDSFPVPETVITFVAQISLQTFTVALILVTLLGWLFWFIYTKNNKLRIFPYILQATIFLNILFHLGNVLLTQQYQMGFFTAIFINFPFSIFVFFQAFKQNWLSKNKIVPLILGVIFFHGPVLLGIMMLSIFLTRVIF